MYPRLIKLAFKQAIDIEGTSEFEQAVFNDSYYEFLTQAQTYNRETNFTTLQQLIDNNPKANSLHYKVGFSIGNHVKNLNGVIPGLTDTLNRVRIGFASHEFQLVSSDITNREKHRVSIFYYSDIYLLHGFFGNCFLLSREQKPPGEAGNDLIESFLLEMQANLSIYNYQVSGLK